MATDEFEASRAMAEIINHIQAMQPALGGRKPIHFLPIPPRWMPYLAQIALGWGRYEQIRDRILEKSFIESRTEAPKSLRSLKGKKRHALFRSQIDLVFELDSPVHSFLHELTDNAIVIQGKRNALLHGEVSLLLAPKPHLLVHDHKRDGSVEVHRFYDETLKTLAIDLMQLNGNIEGLKPPSYAGLMLSSRDKSKLQRLCAKDFPPLPIR
jgi:hypothetical protein